MFRRPNHPAFLLLHGCCRPGSAPALLVAALAGLIWLRREAHLAGNACCSRGSSVPVLFFHPVGRSRVLSTCCRSAPPLAILAGRTLARPLPAFPRPGFGCGDGTGCPGRAGLSGPQGPLARGNGFAGRGDGRHHGPSRRGGRIEPSPSRVFPWPEAAGLDGGRQAGDLDTAQTSRAGARFAGHRPVSGQCPGVLWSPPGVSACPSAPTRIIGTRPTPRCPTPDLALRQRRLSSTSSGMPTPPPATSFLRQPRPGGWPASSAGWPCTPRPSRSGLPPARMWSSRVIVIYEVAPMKLRAGAAVIAAVLVTLVSAGPPAGGSHGASVTAGGRASTAHADQALRLPDAGWPHLRQLLWQLPWRRTVRRRAPASPGPKDGPGGGLRQAPSPLLGTQPPTAWREPGDHREPVPRAGRWTASSPRTRAQARNGTTVMGYYGPPPAALLLERGGQLRAVRPLLLSPPPGNGIRANRSYWVSAATAPGGRGGVPDKGYREAANDLRPAAGRGA